MNALLGVAQGSVRPARVMIMKWNGLKEKKYEPIAFIGKGVTFDTGGISIKPSSRMQDMKWDMGGAGVVAGLMYTLALGKAKANVIGLIAVFPTNFIPLTVPFLRKSLIGVFFLGVFIKFLSPAYIFIIFSSFSFSF